MKTLRRLLLALASLVSTCAPCPAQVIYTLDGNTVVKPSFWSAHTIPSQFDKDATDVSLNHGAFLFHYVNGAGAFSGATATFYGTLSVPSGITAGSFTGNVKTQVVDLSSGIYFDISGAMTHANLYPQQIRSANDGQLYYSDGSAWTKLSGAGTGAGAVSSVNGQTGAVSLTLPATAAATTHQFLSSYNPTTGMFTLAQPAAADITGLGTAATQPASAFDSAGAASSAQAAAVQRANHTGTQTASTISDFTASVQTVGDARYATSSQGAKADTAVQPARQVVAGTGLSGGGDLSADRTLSVAYGTATGTAAQGNDSRLGLAATAVQPSTAPTLTGTNITGIPESGVSSLTSDLAARATLAGAQTFAGTITFTLAPVFTAQAATRTALGLGGASTLNVGTASGTVAAGNDSRFAGVTPEQYGAVGDGTTDDSAAIQAALNAIPAQGGTILFAAKTYKVNSSLTVSKPTKCVGAGAGQGTGYSTYGGLYTAQGTVILTMSPTIYLFNVTSPGCTFEDMQLRNTSTATAGAAILFTQGIQFHLHRCFFNGGFYTQVQVTNGFTWDIANCYFLNPVMYGLSIADAAYPDSGDPSVVGCTFGANQSAANSAAIVIYSGGGLKFTGNKINGTGVSGSFTTGILMQSASQTSDLLITGNSLENCLVAAVDLGLGTGGNTWANLNITGNQIALTPNGIITRPGILHVLIADNQFRLTGGTDILLAGGTDISVGHNSHSSMGGGSNLTGVYIDPAAVGVKVARQNFDVVPAGATYATVATSQPASTNPATVESDYRRPLPASLSAATVLYQLRMNTYTCGTFTFYADMLVSGVGTVAVRCERAYQRAAGSVSLTTLGTDVIVGPAASGLTVSFDTATSADKVYVTLQDSGGSITGTSRLNVTGSLFEFGINF